MLVLLRRPACPFPRGSHRYSCSRVLGAFLCPDSVFALPRVCPVAAFVTPIGPHHSLLRFDIFLSNAIIEKSVLFFVMAIQYFYRVAVP